MIVTKSTNRNKFTRELTREWFWFEVSFEYFNQMESLFWKLGYMIPKGYGMVYQNYQKMTYVYALYPLNYFWRACLFIKYNCYFRLSHWFIDHKFLDHEECETISVWWPFKLHL